VLGHPEGDPADEGGDQPVPDRNVGDAVGEDANPQREDALVASDDPASRQMLGEPAGSQAEGDPDRGPNGGLAEQLHRFPAGVASWRGEDDEEEDEGQGDAIV
jgi:hypothetical protein